MGARFTAGTLGLTCALALAGCALAWSPTPTPVPTPDLQIRVEDQTGWLLDFGTAWPGQPPDDGGDPLRTRLFNPDGDLSQLVVYWVSGVCLYDRSITLVQDGGRLVVDLDRGAPAANHDACPAMAVSRAVRLTLDRPVAARDVISTIHGSD